MPVLHIAEPTEGSAASFHRSRATLLLLVLLSVLLAVVGCARRAALYQPQPVSFVRLPVEDVEAGIYAGARRRGWVPTKLHDGLIQATLHLRSHVAVVDIAYEADSFRLRYVRSENLNYEREADGTQQIHQHFNIWQQNLIQDISEELSGQRKKLGMQ
jgi:hypothetical protein